MVQCILVIFLIGFRIPLLLFSSAHDGRQSSSTEAERYLDWSKFCSQVHQDKISE